MLCQKHYTTRRLIANYFWVFSRPPGFHIMLHGVETSNELSGLKNTAPDHACRQCNGLDDDRWKVNFDSIYSCTTMYTLNACNLIIGNSHVISSLKHSLITIGVANSIDIRKRFYWCQSFTPTAVRQDFLSAPVAIAKFDVYRLPLI